jgi:hypothetical protein
MNIPSHSSLIKDKMQQLANVTTQAVTRITEQILSNAANALRDSIGSSGYEEYLDKLMFTWLLLNHCSMMNLTQRTMVT